jgi:hypothetical protein
MVTAITPLRALGRLTRGLISGKVRDHNGEIYYDLIGPTLNDSWASNVLFSENLIKVAIADPWLFPILAAPIIDNEVMIICKRKNSLRVEEEKFCQRYIGLKERMLVATAPFEKAGAAIHNFFSSKEKEELEDEAPLTEQEVLASLKDFTEDNFCPQMVSLGEKYQKSKKQIKAKANKETWRMGTNPERYGHPEIGEIVTEKNKLLAPEQTYSERVLRNVIISLGPPADKTQGLDTKLAVKEYRKIYRKFKKLAKTGRKIFQKSKTIEQCQELKEKYKFDYKELEAVAEEMESKEIHKRLFENDRIKKQFKAKNSFLNYIRPIRLDWEFIENGDVATIHEVLNSKDVGNVILTIHGTQKGKLIDSNLNELPRTMFHNISASIMSLNFFSCYSQKIDSYYQITKSFEGMNSYHKLRHLSFVELDDSYSYKDGQVPVNSFAGYFSEIDHFLHKATRGSLLQQSLNTDATIDASQKLCEVQVHKLEQSKVEFSVTLNNHQLGFITGENQKSRFEFDCSILNQDENTLRINDINVRHNESLSLENGQVYIIHPRDMREFKTSDFKVMRSRKTGAVYGLRKTFDLIIE